MTEDIWFFMIHVHVSCKLLNLNKLKQLLDASFFKIHEPFLFGKYSQLNSEKNEKSLCFLHEIEGDILFSKMVEGCALIFYLREANRFNFMETYIENITYIFRYYPLIEMGACTNIDNNDSKHYFFNENDMIFQPIIRKSNIYDEIVINNSSLVNFIDFEENIIVYSKIYDTTIFRSLIKRLNVWEEETAFQFTGDQHKRTTQQTIALKILHKNYRDQVQVLTIYVW